MDRLGIGRGEKTLQRTKGSLQSCVEVSVSRERRVFMCECSTSSVQELQKYFPANTKAKEMCLFLSIHSDMNTYGGDWLS